MKEKVAAVLERLRPSLQFDGGDVELVDLNEREGVVTLRLLGSCSGCLMSDMSVKIGIESALRQEAPEIREVVTV